MLFRSDDGLSLVGARITNAVKCVPPENKPIGSEIATCSQFLLREIETMPDIKMILALGLIAHNAVLKVMKKRIGAHKFIHGAVHDLGDICLIDSYHCSRYNTNTGRLTTEMFEDVFKTIRNHIP